MSRRRLVTILALGILATGGCAVADQDRAVVADDDSVPFGLLEPDAPPLLPPISGVTTETAAICYVRDESLTVVEVPLGAPAEPSDVVGALVEPPDAAGVRTALTDPSIVRDVRVVGGIARVDLRPSVSILGGSDQRLAVAQLVCTLTGRPGVGQVSFTLDGSPVDVPRGDGSLTSQPVSRDDYAVLLG